MITNKKILIITSIFIIVGMIFIYLANTITTTKPIVYQVVLGDTLYSSTNKLENLGLAHSGALVIMLAKLTNLDTEIKSGYYDINTNMGVIELLTNFTNATIANENVRLIEGQTMQQYYQQLSNNKVLKNKHSLQEIMDLLNINKPYEGYFWPNTYKVNYASTVLSVFQRSNQFMQQKLKKAWDSRAKNHPLKNIHQALTLASLIEKETAKKTEKPIIAGVLIQRLKKKHVSTN